MRIVANADWLALAVFVRERREELGLSIKAAATRAGVSTTWWRQLETGRRRVRGGTFAEPNARGDYLGRAARALEVPLADLKRVLGG